MRSSIPPPPVTTFYALPLSPKALDELLDHFVHLQFTLEMKHAAGDLVGGAQAQQELQALGDDVFKLHQQHRSCLRGVDGTQHGELGACAVGTRWQPDGSVDVRRLQSERTAEPGGEGGEDLDVVPGARTADEKGAADKGVCGGAGQSVAGP